MALFRAIFENGTVRPLVPVELPEGCEVEIEPRLVRPTHMNDVYRVLAERYVSGETNVAESHNEHQPSTLPALERPNQSLGS
jgi:predicted DNA-binding antitoxin AbrB/MazE fold protein